MDDFGYFTVNFFFTHLIKSEAKAEIEPSTTIDLNFAIRVSKCSTTVAPVEVINGP